MAEEPVDDQVWSHCESGRQWVPVPGGTRCPKCGKITIIPSDD